LGLWYGLHCLVEAVGLDDGGIFAIHQGSEFPRVLNCLKVLERRP